MGYGYFQVFLGVFQHKFAHFLLDLTFIQGPTFIVFVKSFRALHLLSALRLVKSKHSSCLREKEGIFENHEW